MTATPGNAFGAALAYPNGAQFRLWCPGCSAIDLELKLERQAEDFVRMRMQRNAAGWHTLLVPGASAGMQYRFRVGADLTVPDPASRFNPLGVHGPSELIDPHAFEWQTPTWRGRPWHTAVIYELHIGTFTEQGTFAAAADRLGELAELGFTAIELMPVAAFAGDRNWGYDGVLPFAVQASYGRPEDLKRFVDAAHAAGLMVFLDVVYNHFGPQGNYLSAYCPEFFDPGIHTPWGAALDLMGAHGATVRQFFVENALYWIEEFRFDGLRLDAVHAMADAPTKQLVRDIAAAIREGPGRTRSIHLILENDANAAHLLERNDEFIPVIATAQWNDDFHHAAHVLATGEDEAYYRDYQQPVSMLGKALAQGFIFQGQASAFRGGQSRGEPSDGLPSEAFVSFLQNHDQIGNRAFGERMDAIALEQRVEALLCCLLLAPHVPMLFMGEEFAAQTPFQYFADVEGELAEAIRAGRRQEFAEFAAFRDADKRARIPDPIDQATFHASRLKREDRNTQRGRARLGLIRRLLDIRRERLLPLMPRQRRGGQSRSSGDILIVDWALGDTRWSLRANFSTSAIRVVPARGTSCVFALRGRAESASDVTLDAAGVYVGAS